MGDYIVSINCAAVLSALESSSQLPKSSEEALEIIQLFESLTEDERKEHASRFFSGMWQIALVAGKISLAKNYAQEALDYLIEHKRVPQMNTFLLNLKAHGLLKNNLKKYSAIESILLGKKNEITETDFEDIDLFSSHCEHWKYSRVFLRQYLLMESEWSLEQWKLCYEFILNFQFDKEIFLVLYQRAHDLNNTEVKKSLSSLFQSKKIKVPALSGPLRDVLPESSERLFADYDQVAMDVMSGVRGPDEQEQIRVSNSLKYLNEDDLRVKGKEMIIAFELLGMDKVVIELCEKVLALIDAENVKERASLYFSWAQALINLEDLFKALELLEEVMAKEPLYGEELLALNYLRAEVLLKLQKLSMAKVLYMEIKKQNPHYRLVGERLKSLEKIK